MDRDVELLKPLDKLLSYDAYFGKETSARVSTGLGFGAKAQHWVVKALLDEYSTANFIIKNGDLDQTACPKRNTKVLVSIGMQEGEDIQNINNVVIFPTEFFCPKKYDSNDVNVTNNTYSIHHFNGSWIPMEYKVKKLIVKIFGKKGKDMIVIYDKVRSSLKG